MIPARRPGLAALCVAALALVAIAPLAAADVLTTKDGRRLEGKVVSETPAAVKFKTGAVAAPEASDIRAAVADLEKRSIEAALLAAGGNKSRAANELGISRFALQRKLDKYGLSKSGPEREDESDAVEEKESASNEE